MWLLLDYDLTFELLKRNNYHHYMKRNTCGPTVRYCTKLSARHNQCFMTEQDRLKTGLADKNVTNKFLFQIFTFTFYK